MEKPILILGGYGTTGRLIAKHLLEETDVQLILAGRNLGKAEALAQELNRAHAFARVSAVRLDAGDASGIRQAFMKTRLVVVASSTSQFTGLIVRAALGARIDYLDVSYSQNKVETLLAMKDDIERAGCCFITEAGFHPGLPAAMVRSVASEFDVLERANVGSVIRLDWKSLSLSHETVLEFVAEMGNFRPLCYKNGKWTEDWKSRRHFEFGAPFGTQPTYPMMLEELRSLPVIIPSLQETGFFVGGFNWFVDGVLLIPSLVALSITGGRGLGPIARLFRWGVTTFSRPPFGTVLCLEASGTKGGARMTIVMRISHRDGYELTAIPVAAALLQYLDGTIRKPGMWLQGVAVEPRRLLRDMSRMGVTVSEDASCEVSPVESCPP